MSAENPSPEPASLPNIADQKADFARWDQEVFGYGDLPSQPEHDAGETRDMEPGLKISPEATAVGQAREAAAREKLAALHHQAPAETATDDQEQAFQRDHPVEYQTGVAIAALNRTSQDQRLNVLLDPSVDDTLHREIFGQVFKTLGLEDPISELEADNRPGWRKLFRPKSRKTTQVDRLFMKDGEPKFVSAIRSYSQANERYELRLYGGEPPELTKGSLEHAASN